MEGAEGTADPAVRFDIDACASPTGDDSGAAPEWPTSRRGGWMRQRARKPLGPRTYRTRLDPFAAVNSEIEQLLAADPERTGRAVFAELQRRYPGVFTDGQLRTLQRRVKEWRTRTLLVFDDSWLGEEPLAGKQWPPALTVATATSTPQPPTDARQVSTGVLE
jgi:hypothetical protein